MSAKCSRARKSIQRRTRAKIAVFSDTKVMAVCSDTKECVRVESKFLSCVATVTLLYSKPVSDTSMSHLVDHCLDHHCSDGARQFYGKLRKV